METSSFTKYSVNCTYTQNNCHSYSSYDLKFHNHNVDLYSLVPYGELKHSGKAIKCDPFSLASLMKLIALFTFCTLSSPTASCIKARRNAANKQGHKWKNTTSLKRSCTKTKWIGFNNHLWFTASTCYNGIKNLLSMWKLQTVPANMSNICLSSINKILTQGELLSFQIQLTWKIKYILCYGQSSASCVFLGSVAQISQQAYSAVHSFLAFCGFC